MATAEYIFSAKITADAKFNNKIIAYVSCEHKNNFNICEQMTG